MTHRLFYYGLTTFTVLLFTNLQTLQEEGKWYVRYVKFFGKGWEILQNKQNNTIICTNV